MSAVEVPLSEIGGSIALQQLQEASCWLDEVGDIQSIHDVIAHELEENVSGFLLHKATKRYWRSWYSTLRERDVCIEFLSGDPKGKSPPSIGIGAKDAELAAARQQTDEEWNALKLQLTELMEEDKRVTFALKRRLEEAQELFGSRKRAEAALQDTKPIGKYSEEREAKRKLRVELQAKEEELRKEGHRIEFEEIAELKTNHAEITSRCKVLSHRTLSKKVCFEEAAEAFKLFLSEIDYSNQTDQADCDVNSNAMEEAEFTTYAQTYLKDPEGELARLKNVFETARTRLLGDYEAAVSLRTVLWISHHPKTKLSYEDEVESLGILVAYVIPLVAKELLPIANSCDSEDDCSVVVWPECLPKDEKVSYEVKPEEVWIVKREARTDEDGNPKSLSYDMQQSIQKCVWTLPFPSAAVLSQEQRKMVYDEFIRIGEVGQTEIKITTPVTLLETLIPRV